MIDRVHRLRFIVRDADGHFYGATGEHGSFTPDLARARFFTCAEHTVEALKVLRRRFPTAHFTMVDLDVNLADFWELREEPA